MQSQIFNWGNIHLVGHSLGAHIMGFVAKKLKFSRDSNGYPWLVSRISALDPAQPCFQNESDTRLRISRNDAAFVDVIHTNGRNIRLFGLGIPDQLGKCKNYYSCLIILYYPTYFLRAY